MNQEKSKNNCGGLNLKTAIVGSSGYIAGYIIKRFEEDDDIESMLKIGMDGNPDAVLNLEEPEKFGYETLNDIDYIIFTAAISGPDKCASDYDFCWNINVNGTTYFIREAIKKNCNVLFFSSDAVFGDIPGMIYDEESKTQAYTPYGKMKKAVEDEFKDNPNFKAIRLSYVASARDRFITYCINCIKNNETADIFHPFYRNVTVVSDVVDVVAYFAKHWDEYEHTFLNVASKELVSRVRMADELNRILVGRLKYTISMPGDEFFTNRPKITQIRSLYMSQYGILPDNTFTEKFQREMEDTEI